jgi:hypothetical protein
MTKARPHFTQQYFVGHWQNYRLKYYQNIASCVPAVWEKNTSAQKQKWLW